MAKRAVRSAVSAPAPVAAAAESPFLSEAEALVTQLMAIPGRSGEEAQVAEFIRQKLLAAGAPADAIVTDDANKRTTLAGNTGNLVFKLPGTLKGPRRMLSAHMDTVPICIGSQPIRDGEYIRSANPRSGLGADDRAGCAVVLAAALAVLKAGLPHPPLTFCWFIQEEIGLHGARHLHLPVLGKPAVCFNWDGGAAEKLTIGATGGYRMEIQIEGLASHAGVAPQLGVSAIAIASLAIADLHRGGWHGLVEKGKNRGTTNVGVIQGGEATNVVTEKVIVRAEARSHDPKFRERIVAEIEKAFTRAVKEVKSAAGKRGRATFLGRLDYESFRLADDAPCVKAAEAAVAAAGLTPVRAISNGGVDANWLNVHGIPTVTLGCGQMDVHTVSERLDLAAFRKACEIGLKLARE